LEQLIGAGERLVISAEVLQEILHRYGAIDRREAIQPAFEALLGVVDEVFDIRRTDVNRAKDLVLSRPRLSAAMPSTRPSWRARGRRIFSFDTGLDALLGVTRLGA
jgi:hypothetical protein